MNHVDTHQSEHGLSSIRHGATFAACALVAAVAAACSPRAGAAAPANARVEVLQTEQLVLRGVADASLQSVACSQAAPKTPQHVLELPADVLGNIRLRPALGEAHLRLAMLHVTHLETNKTWCTTTLADGSPATIPGGFPAGTYSIAVASAAGATAPRYEVVVQKL